MIQSNVTWFLSLIAQSLFYDTRRERDSSIVQANDVFRKPRVNITPAGSADKARYSQAISALVSKLMLARSIVASLFLFNRFLVLYKTALSVN